MPTPDLVAVICVWKTIMNKRFTSLMTTLILSVFFAISASAYDVEVDGIYYNLNKYDKTAEVTYKVKQEDTYKGEIEIPSLIEIDGEKYSVTKIGSYAFWLCQSLKSVIIPNSIIYIYEYAFCASGIEELIIPDSVIKIGENAFEGCRNLVNLILSNSITTIESRLFYDCSGLTSIIIPNSVTSIDDYSFVGCTGITSISIPNSVASIGNGAFQFCTGLTSITIPNSVKSIGGGVFKDCI